MGIALSHYYCPIFGWLGIDFTPRLAESCLPPHNKPTRAANAADLPPKHAVRRRGQRGI